MGFYETAPLVFWGMVVAISAGTHVLYDHIKSWLKNGKPTAHK